MATTQIEKKTSYGLGTAGHSALSQQFATVLEDYIPKVAMALQQENTDEVQLGNPDVPAFDPNYSGSPTIEKFHPDRGWPAGGTTNPADITAGPPAKASGAGSQDQPVDSAASISKQKIGALILGSSKPG
jgi:hypothetical protein